MKWDVDALGSVLLNLNNHPTGQSQLTVSPVASAFGLGQGIANNGELWCGAVWWFVLACVH